MRRSRTGRVHGRARLVPGAASGAAASRTSARPPGAARRAAGLLGIAGLTATATIGFTAAAAMASPSPSTSDGLQPTAKSPSMSVSLISKPDSVKSGATATYTATVKVTDKGAADRFVVDLVGDRHGAKLSWDGCDSIVSGTCVLKAADGTRTPTATLTAPSVTEDTSITLAAQVTADKDGSGKPLATETSSARKLTVEKKATSTPTKSPTPTPTKTMTAEPAPTKSHKPRPTPSHEKPRPTKSSSHPGKQHSSQPSSHPSTPAGNGHVPYPHHLPTGLPNGLPSNLPNGIPTTGLDVPAGKQSPFPLGSDPSSTGVPALPTVAPSPDGTARNPHVADPQKKASGLVHGDAVSVPAAAAAAFIGLGAGTLITRAVRRRGMWHPVGRHRE